ncbi:MAG TPA: hypothetical protein DDZ80_29865 [Cyanobacteria bacterium UBA8803]|nr:hypothetical protein [Cyanobacteria bacterium UBA9273]HBL62447.1 hypothetical protein [Cyanobacteria bacterium UBA8803]
MKRQHLSQRKNAIASPQSQSHAIAQYSPHPIEELQSAIGNRSVNQLLANQPIVQTKLMFRGLSHELGCTVLDIREYGEQQTNKSGLPANLKAGIENLSGISMHDVRVHYNSDKPAHLQALAYTHGTDIHVAPGQEQHLPHEAWHVVQQKQGRVKPTGQVQEVAINDDTTLEREADVIGKRINNFEHGNLLGKTVGDSGMMENNSSSTSFSPVLQRVQTSRTDQLSNATPRYLRELSTIHNPGLWDYTNQGTFAVSHKGRKYALGVDDAQYSDRILARTIRRKWGWSTYHFRQEIDVKDDQLKNNLHGQDCSNAAEYLMHYEQGIDLTDSSITPNSQEEATTHTNADYDPTTHRPNVISTQVPANVKDANARAEIGEAYCIVSQPGAQGVYNFHYGCVAAKKGDEALTVEGFATGSATIPDWSFNVYDDVTTFHDHWQASMTPRQGTITAGYPFTFIAKLS